LLTVGAGAFAGLALVPSHGTDVLVAAAPLAFSEVTPPGEDPADLDRASRSRPRVALSPRAAVVKASPTPKPVAKPTPVAVSKKLRTAPATRLSGGRCPLPAANFTDTYGAPRSDGRGHLGTDLLAPYGSPVYAVADGVIDATSSSRGGISLYLWATSGDRFFYAHNSENIARDGQRVQAGELIARVGSTGNAGSINHVHFEREVGGNNVNPYAFVRALC
ncbi:MAG: M23 family metallopeptidase, partial [Frankiales bacterium]|nr:M23 family metallopeptidase [Frankiales bacterium]